tara:strand:+ start:1323 stop:1808 length:486 start_codon:yes stop_codon:yes gene_type:complete
LIVIIKIALILVLGLIAFQDIRDQKVNWILFPITAILLFTIYQNNTTINLSYTYLAMNILMVTSILGILFIYTKYIRGMEFLNVSFGLGDVLFFYAFALGFPTLTFLILFVCSIVFSLIITLFKTKEYNTTGIPLAGLMSLFLIVIFSFGFISFIPSLYSI